MPHPYPFVPQKTFGAILKKGEAQMVLWMDDGSVEPAFEGSASTEDVEQLQEKADTLTFLPEMLGLSITFGRRVEALGRLGYEDVGSRRFDFSSGIFYGYSRRLARLCRSAHDERQAILERHAGQHPDIGSEDWEPWTQATMTMGACATGARLLAIASVEALLNEILAEKFPDEYSILENKRVGWPGKAERLHDLMNHPEPNSIEELRKENALRRSIAHHKPVYVDDFSPGHSVEASPRTSCDGMDRLLETVDQVFVDTFGMFDIEVPQTHRQGFM